MDLVRASNNKSTLKKIKPKRIIPFLPTTYEDCGFLKGAFLGVVMVVTEVEVVGVVVVAVVVVVVVGVVVIVVVVVDVLVVVFTVVCGASKENIQVNTQSRDRTVLTHYQTTNLRLFQTKKVCRQQFQI